MKHSAIVADTSRIGCKADVAAAAVGIAAALEERGYPARRRRAGVPSEVDFDALGVLSRKVMRII